MVEAKGPTILLDTAKCHFRTADVVLEQAHLTRQALGPEGAVVSKVEKGGFRRPPRKPPAGDMNSEGHAS
jgi:hypothetical protein